MIELLKELLPVLASRLIKDPDTRKLVERLTAIGEQEVQRRMDQTGKSRAEALAEFGAKWDENIRKAEELKEL